MVRKIKIEKRCKKKKMKQRRFTNKKLISLMLPLAVDQLLNSFMGTVDTLVVSNLGSAAISAVSLVDSINILVVQAFFALASGGTVVCSHYLGCEKKERATNAARQLVFITFAMSLVIAIACHLFSNQLLGVIFGQVEPAVMDNAKKYFFFSAMSYPFIALYDDGACILRAQENSKLPMQISFVANGINVALNLIFVWVLHLGVAGSSAATMIARAFAMVAVLYKLRNPKMKIQLRDYFSIRPEWEEIKRILHIGVPSGIENGMFQFGKLAIQSTVSLMGTAAIAAQGMTNIIENLNGIMSIGMGIGLMTVVGECLGAGEKEEAVYYIKKISIAAEVVLIATCLLMFGLTYPITYFGGMEPESAKLCIFMVTCITIVKPIVWIMAFIPPYGLRAAGDVKFSMIYNDDLHAVHVALQSCACYGTCESFSYGTDRSVDRNVYRLDDPGHRIHIPLYGPEMARA